MPSICTEQKVAQSLFFQTMYNRLNTSKYMYRKKYIHAFELKRTELFQNILVPVLHKKMQSREQSFLSSASFSQQIDQAATPRPHFAPWLFSGALVEVQTAGSPGVTGCQRAEVLAMWPPHTAPPPQGESVLWVSACVSDCSAT